MQLFNSIDQTRHTAIYVRISTASQKTDRQQEELTTYAEVNQLNFNRNLDVFIDVVSGFKDGEERPNFSALKTKIALGEYRQVLFSEFIRLDRKPSNLLKDLEWFQEHDCPAYFHKQNLWVKDQSDIGTRIMIQVLAVMSQYEIELFASRGIDGKISAIKNRKTTKGGLCAYGYRISEDSTLVIDETEAAVIRRIFDMFLHGVRVRTIKDTLNSENVPCLYKSRQNAVNSKRKNKGLEPMVYKRGNLENMIWRETTIRRILRNPIYVGIQKHKFHEPDPAGTTPEEFRKRPHSLPINERIAGALFKGGKAEGWGRGILNIFTYCKEAGLPEPEYDFVTHFVCLTIRFKAPLAPRLTGDTINDTINDTIKSQLNSDELDIYLLVKDNPGIRRKGLSEKAGKSISTVARQIIELQEKGLVEHKGSKKKGGYYVK